MPKRPFTAPSDAEPSNKRAKSAGNAAKSREGKQLVSTEKQTDDSGDAYWELSSGGTRRATINEFKGTIMINIREYYEAGGEKKPGKKGISLPIDQFAALLDVLPQIESELKDKGQSVPRPHYEDEAPAAPVASKPEEAEADDDAVDEEHEDAEQEEKPSPVVAKAMAPKKAPKKETKKKNYEATDDEEDIPAGDSAASKLAKFKYG